MRYVHLQPAKHSQASSPRVSFAVSPPPVTTGSACLLFGRKNNSQKHLQELCNIVFVPFLVHNDMVVLQTHSCSLRSQLSCVSAPLDGSHLQRHDRAHKSRHQRHSCLYTADWPRRPPQAPRATRRSRPSFECAHFRPVCF